MHPRRWPTWTLMLLIMGVAIAGCTGPGDEDDGNGAHNGTDPEDPSEPALWMNPYPFEIHFDGERAYTDLLEQIYDEPESHAGARYRIPGTETHETVADELFTKLRLAMESTDASVAYHNFTGESYYGLDLEPVERFVCEEDTEARERVRDLRFMNIVARTNATHHGLVIAGHWDSKRFADSDPESPGEPVLGADDGASATAAVIELARAFAAEDVDQPLTFILFDGEDGFDPRDCHPLAGSLHYAQQLTDDEKDTVDGLILLDMVGNRSASYHREGHSQCYPYTECTVNSKWLVNHVWQTAATMEVEAFVNGSTGALWDDHLPFLHEGIHAIDIIRYENGFAPYWHTTRDDHTAVHPDGIEQVGVVVEAAIRLYAEDLDPVIEHDAPHEGPDGAS